MGTTFELNNTWNDITCRIVVKTKYTMDNTKLWANNTVELPITFRGTRRTEKY